MIFNEDIAKQLQPYQIEKLIEIVRDFHWMARRYADGRMSYVTGMFNEHVRALQQMGIELNPTGDDTIWAHDRMGRAFDNAPQDAEQLELSIKTQEEKDIEMIKDIQNHMLGL